MIPISPIALPLLLAAAQHEQRRLIAVQEAVGDDWPDGFDANDIPLYAYGIEATDSALRNQRSEVALSGKPLWFLLALIPGYVEANDRLLSVEEYAALRVAYSHQVEWLKVPFPDRPGSAKSTGENAA